MRCGELWRNRQREFSIAAAIVAIGAVLAAAWRRLSSRSPILRDLLLANVPALIVAVGMTLIVIAARNRYFRGLAIRDLQRGGGRFRDGRIADVRRIIAATAGGRIAGRDQWRADGLGAHSLDRGYAGRDGGAARRLALGYARRVGAEPAARLPLVRACVKPPANGSRSARPRPLSRRSRAGDCAIWRRAARFTRRARMPTRRGWRESIRNLVVFGVFALTGALTGFAAALNAVRFEQIPSNAGLGLELKVIAAAVVGGVSITGGRGTMLGAVLGRSAAGTDWARADVSRIQRLLGARDRRRHHSGGGFAMDAARSHNGGAMQISLPLIEHRAWRRALVSQRRMGVGAGAAVRDRDLLRDRRKLLSRAENFFEVIRLSVELGCLSLAMTPIIITGGIDLSVGSMMALAAVVFGAAWHDGGLPIPVAAVLALLTGCAGGALNAALITRLNIPPLIVTLGSFSLFRGIAEGIDARLGELFRLSRFVSSGWGKAIWAAWFRCSSQSFWWRWRRMRFCCIVPRSAGRSTRSGSAPAGARYAGDARPAAPGDALFSLRAGLRAGGDRVCGALGAGEIGRRLGLRIGGDYRRGVGRHFRVRRPRHDLGDAVGAVFDFRFCRTVCVWPRYPPR